LQITILSLAFVLLFRAIGIFVPVLADWHTDARCAMALFFVIAGLSHFGPARAEFVGMVPPWVPVNHDVTIVVTGVLELCGGIGLLVPATTRVAGIALALFLVAVFPANMYAAEHHLRIFGREHPALLPRTIDQIVLLALVIWSAI
jgi:uncharacterized membrane protein